MLLQTHAGVKPEQQSFGATGQPATQPAAQPAAQPAVQPAKKAAIHVATQPGVQVGTHMATEAWDEVRKMVKAQEKWKAHAGLNNETEPQAQPEAGAEMGNASYVAVDPQLEVQLGVSTKTEVEVEDVEPIARPRAEVEIGPVGNVEAHFAAATQNGLDVQELADAGAECKAECAFDTEAQAEDVTHPQRNGGAVAAEAKTDAGYSRRRWELAKPAETSGNTQCRSGAKAGSAPPTRLVQLCEPRLSEAWRQLSWHGQRG